jgi:hypothetical protein
MLRDRARFIAAGMCPACVDNVTSNQRLENGWGNVADPNGPYLHWARPLAWDIAIDKGPDWTRVRFETSCGIALEHVKILKE